MAVAGVGMVPPKGSWQTPWQVHRAFSTAWPKFLREEFDEREYERTKRSTYFNQERNIVLQSDFDRLFHPIESSEPKIKLKALRKGIMEEEKARTIPVLVSHIYGHRTTDLEGKIWVSHKRTDVMSEICRRYYVNLKPSKKLPTAHYLETA